jgi:membrane fusion protein, multidrug efflux system
MSSANFDDDKVTLGKSTDTQVNPYQPYYHKWNFWLFATILLIIIAISAHYYSIFSSKNKQKKAAIPVVTAIAKSSTVPVYLSALGTVTPTYNVTVRTQLDGQLWHVLFQEGQDVKANDVLAEIDPRPYQALVTQYEGQLKRDLELLANAKIDLKRYTVLNREDSIAEQIWATQASLVKQLEGTVKLDQGQLDGARVNLSYCKITSPVSGRVGLRLVDPGNFVQVSDTTGIAVINTLNPIEVVFTLPEDSIPQVIKAISLKQKLEANAYDRAMQKLLSKGSLFALDNQIDTTTGTVKLKAQFQNADYLLFPNQFVNVQLLVDTLHNATVVPTAAIQNGVNGTFVYRLNTNNTVSVIPVKVGVTIGDNSTLSSGILPGQSVVIEGVDKLTEGTSVTVYTPSTSSQSKKTSQTSKSTVALLSTNGISSNREEKT